MKPFSIGLPGRMKSSFTSCRDAQGVHRARVELRSVVHGDLLRIAPPERDAVEDVSHFVAGERRFRGRRPPRLDGPGVAWIERTRARRAPPREAPSLRTLYMSGYLDHPGRPRQGGLDPAVNLLEKRFAAQEILRKGRETLDAD